MTLARAESSRQSSGSTRDDGKRPDGLTLIHWRLGLSATCDVTVIDTLAASYLAQSARLYRPQPDANVTNAQRCRRLTCSLYTITIETLGPICSDGRSFLSDLGTRITSQTNDPTETALLFQRISVAVQRFSAVCIANIVSPSCRPNFSNLIHNHFRQVSTLLKFRSLC